MKMSRKGRIMSEKSKIKNIRKKFGVWGEREIQEAQSMFLGEERGKPRNTRNTNRGGTESNFCRDLALGSALLRSGGCGEPTIPR